MYRFLCYGKKENILQKFYKMNIAGIERSLQLFKINDSLQIAAFILFGDVEITKASAKQSA